MLRCSPEAYAKCPDRQYCSSFEDAVFCEGSECHCFNLFVELAGGLPARFFDYDQVEDDWKRYLEFYGVKVP